MKRFIHNRIYFVTCEELSQGRSDEELVQAVLFGGVRVIQLRDKHSSKSALLKKAIRLRNLTSVVKAVLIINDDPELALEVGADGVHLGQEDYPVMEARKLSYRDRRGEDLIVGLSTHNLNEVRLAQSCPVDYINIGPIYPTQTKKNKYPPIVNIEENGKQKFSLLQEMVLYNRHPFTVMGGIKKKHIVPLIGLGVKHFAMVTAISQHPNPGEHAAYLTRMTARALKDRKSNTDADRVSLNYLLGDLETRREIPKPFNQKTQRSLI